MFPRLLADIGGTNIRLASQSSPGAALDHVGRYACSSFSTLEQAISHHLDTTGQPRPAAAAFGIATSVDGDWVRMTNHSWEFSRQELAQQLGLERLIVVNDFKALALAVPGLRGCGLRVLREGRSVADAPSVVIGPGTGLGVAAVIPLWLGQPPLALCGEGGHATLGSNDPQEQAVLQCLARRYGHVSAERALCGQGLVDLYVALCELRGRRPRPTVCDPKALQDAALLDAEPDAQDAVLMFCALLGGVAGNAALTYGALGGVYIAGGVVPRLGALFEVSTFLQRFQQKGRFTGYLERIPVYLIESTEMAALHGASIALEAALA